MGHAILWESGHLSSGKYPLGIGNFGDGLAPFLPVRGADHVDPGSNISQNHGKLT